MLSYLLYNIFRVYDEFDERDVVRCEDGSFMIATSIPKGDWLYHYILSFGTAIEVIEPESLRNIILAKLEMMIRVHYYAVTIIRRR